jgi:hypothetical protein
MLILVANAGSSSLKFSAVDGTSGTRLHVIRITGAEGAAGLLSVDGKDNHLQGRVSHHDALAAALTALQQSGLTRTRIAAVGHRAAPTHILCRLHILLVLDCAAPAGDLSPGSWRKRCRRGIRAQHRHIHGIHVHGTGRSLSFGDVLVRISDSARLETHIDSDEANAAGIGSHLEGEFIGVPHIVTLTASGLKT